MPDHVKPRTSSSIVEVMTVRNFSHGHRVGYEVYISVLYGVLIMCDRRRMGGGADLYFKESIGKDKGGDILQ